LRRDGIRRQRRRYRPHLPRTPDHERRAARSRQGRRWLGDAGMSDALRLSGLTKKFGDKIAVNNLDLTVRAGELYGLLGPNGAGKTTTLSMVAGLLNPDAGSISVYGIDSLADPIAAKRVMAWQPDEPALYDKLTAWEYLEFIAGLWSVDVKTARTRAEE